MVLWPELARTNPPQVDAVDDRARGPRGPAPSLRRPLHVGVGAAAERRGPRGKFRYIFTAKFTAYRTAGKSNTVTIAERYQQRY